MFNWFFNLFRHRHRLDILHSHVTRDVRENFFYILVNPSFKAKKNDYYSIMLNLAQVTSISPCKGIVAAKEEYGTVIHVQDKIYYSCEDFLDLIKDLGLDDDSDDDDGLDKNDPNNPPVMTSDDFDKAFRG